MGVKRQRDDTMEDLKSSSPFLPMFEAFRKELDEHHDRRERVIKRSRDITASSKKIIFGLQRTRTIGLPLPNHVVKTTEPHDQSIKTNFKAAAQDLDGSNGYRYARNISGGIQECTEAYTFQHYLETGQLLPYEELHQRFLELTSIEPTEDVPRARGIDFSVDDYVLGLYDMTGELMRFAITAMATSGELPQVTSHPTLEPPVPIGQRTALSDLRRLRAGLESLDTGRSGFFARDVEKKAEVMRASVEKVEKALYGLVVRGAERPKGWVPDLDAGPGPREVDVES